MGWPATCLLVLLSAQALEPRQEEAPVQAAAPRPKTVQARLRPWLNAPVMVASVGALQAAAWLGTAACMHAALSLGLTTAGNERGPWVLAQGVVDTPIRRMAWRFSSAEVAVISGGAAVVLALTAAVAASSGLWVLAAGTVFPQVDGRGLLQFSLRGASFHALMTATGLLGVAAAAGALGVPLTLLLAGLGPRAAQAPWAPQFGPFLLVGSVVSAGLGVILLAAAAQLAWTSVWAAPPGLLAE